MKGVFESRRPKPKYDKIWDVSVVLKHLSSYANFISFKSTRAIDT